MRTPSVRVDWERSSTMRIPPVAGSANPADPAEMGAKVTSETFSPPASIPSLTVIFRRPSASASISKLELPTA